MCIRDSIKAAAATLRDQYGSTGYATRGALVAAQALQAQKDVDGARQQLEWLAGQTKNPSMQAVARLRLAGLLLDQKQYDAALGQLNNPPAAFAALFADRRGDILAAQGKREDARAAWQSAIDGLGTAKMCIRDRGIAYSAYQAENFRAGIEAIDRGQIEAAMAMGMSWSMTMRRVVLPQAVKIVLPPYGNIMIMMLKDSSQASTITVAELALQGKLIAVSTFKNATVFSLVALMYLVMCVPLILLVRHLEKRSACLLYTSRCV